MPVISRILHGRAFALVKECPRQDSNLPVLRPPSHCLTCENISATWCFTGLLSAQLAQFAWANMYPDR